MPLPAPALLRSVWILLVLSVSVHTPAAASQSRSPRISRESRRSLRIHPSIQQHNDVNRALPPYTSPGSWLGCETEDAGPGSNTQGAMSFWQALWDGTTGSNYSSLIASLQEELSWVVSPGPARRITALWNDAISKTAPVTLGLFSYAPNSAITPVGDLCTLDPSVTQDATAIAFSIGDTVYFMRNTTLFRADAPTQPDVFTAPSALHSPTAAACVLTPLLSLPVPYSPAFYLSVTQSHVFFGGMNPGDAAYTLVDLWFDPTSTGTEAAGVSDSRLIRDTVITSRSPYVTDSAANITLTSQPLSPNITSPAAFPSLWVQEDTTTGDLYMSVLEGSEDTPLFYRGTRSEGEPQGYITWTLLGQWKGSDPGYFSLDSRYNSAYGGPLLCSEDSYYYTYCVSLNLQIVFKGPQLRRAFAVDGFGCPSVYDATCNP